MPCLEFDARFPQQNATLDRMPLSSGERLGPYEIVAPIGKGGMGEVFRARDPRLGRDVAIKVSNVEFTERFAREARSIAALNHTNICHLYDVGPNYLVLEYVEGAALKGPLSFEDALPILRQLIDGIEAAHEKNIIHRDLKPANIRITPEGVVKILDFGLAKAAEPESGGDPETSPTLTMGATQAGQILGTAAYMPPEQAKGKTADKRSDIWSFGVVAYELLTGRRPFEGETIVEILGAALNKEPDWSRVPPRAERLLRWCLEKDRKNRLASISDARILLEGGLEPARDFSPAPARKNRIAWPAAATLGVLAAIAAFGWWTATRPVDSPLIRLSVDLGSQAVRGQRITAAISPDGTRIVHVADGGGGLIRLHTRRLDQTEATPLIGTESATALQPFFSANGEWIGFFTDGTLRKVSTQGGSPVTLARPPSGAYGASWGDDGNILVGGFTGLVRIPEAGGSPQQLDPQGGFQVFPHVLPGSKAVLFNSVSATTINRLDDLDILARELPGGETKTLVRGGYYPHYLPTYGATGHLVYVREGTLFGVRFDPSSLQVQGTPVPLLEDVAADSSQSGGGQYSISSSGTLVYLRGKYSGAGTPILWLDAAGQVKPLIAQTGPYAAPRLSHDGKKLAYTMSAGKGEDVWVHDLDRETPTQITFTGPGARELAWAPDSRHVVYGDGRAMWWIRADGSGQPIKLLDEAINPRPGFFAPDGRLVYAPAPSGLPDVFTLPVDLSDPEQPKPGKPEVFLGESTYVEVDPAFSPDGKFIAYASSESGAEEIYVRPFPGPGGKWKVSTAGGKFPVFARLTRELFFLGGDDRIWVASYTIQGGAFSAGKARVWSPTAILRDGVRQNFDISPDGKRAVVFPARASASAQGSLHATFLLNFFDEVRRRIP